MDAVDIEARNITHFVKRASEYKSTYKRLNMKDPEWADDSIYQNICLYETTPFQHEEEFSNLTETQVKRKHVIKSLIDTEQSYIECLGKLVKDFQPMINSLFTCQPQVMTSFIYLRLMLIQHVKCQEKLKDRSYKNVTDFFKDFAEQEIINLYSLYINSYSMAIDTLKEAEKRKPAFRDFQKAQGTLSMEALMLRPVQRFPQFILILKDLLKYTPDDDEEYEKLQNSLLLLEHVGHQLNERRRRSEQTLQAQRIYTKMKLNSSADRVTHWLVRQDDVQQLSPAINEKQPSKQRRLLLMNACIVSTCTSQSEDYIFKWSVGLQHLDLSEQSMTPGMTLKSKHGKNTDIKTEIDILKDDHIMLEKMMENAKSLNRSYPDLLADLEKNLRIVRQQIQMTLNTTGVELIDSSRNRTYAFLFDNSDTKQEWCADFLITKNALESSNSPVWSLQGETITDSVLAPACFFRPLKADAPRQVTKAKCVTPVIIPLSDNNDIGVSHLWVCSATEVLGEVSIISLYSGRPNVLECFTACESEIVCAETIPCSADVQQIQAFPMDTVWMGTVDSEIIVFPVSSPHNQKRTPVHTFHTTGVVVALKYVKDRVFAGCRTGTMLIFTRDKNGVWSENTNVVLGYSPVSSILSWQSDIVIGCGKSLFVFEAGTFVRKPNILLQTENTCEESISSMVQTGQCVWLSYFGLTIVRLYQMASGKLLQEYDVKVDLNEFFAYTLKGCVDFQHSLEHKITSLMTCPGLLWIGTDNGIVLNYPILLNQDSSPKLIMKPNISMHGYCGSAKFFSIVPIGSVASKSLPGNSLHHHLKSMENDDADYQDAVGGSKPCGISPTDATVQDAHIYMTLLPESSKPSSVQEDCTKCFSKSEPSQIPRNFGVNTIDTKTHISLIGDIFTKELVSQDNPNRPIMNDPGNILKHNKTVKVQDQGQSTTDRNASVNGKSSDQKIKTLMQRVDGIYDPTRHAEDGELLNSSNMNSTSTVMTVPLTGLKRQSAIKLPKPQSIKDSISTGNPISHSGSWETESTNTYVVISGGDGYRDWKSRDPVQYRNDEAFLLSWIVKI